MSNGPEEKAEQAIAGRKVRLKDRSPNYPVMDLGKALEKATILHGEFRTHEIPIGMAHERCGYKSLSGAGNQCIAALKAYGLVNVTGQSDQRKVSVSVEGDRIIRNAPDRVELLKTAALKPTLHRELWNHYQEKGGVPVDDLLRHYLVWDRPEPRFNEKSVGGFIADFRATLKLAGLEKGDIIEAAEDDDRQFSGDLEATSDMPPTAATFRGEVEKMTTGDVPRSAATVNAAADRLLRSNEGMKDFPLYTTTSRGALYVPSSMDQNDFNLLKQQIDAYMKVIEATSVRPDTPANG